MSDPLLGRVIAGRIRVLERIGEGGMGRVYRAHHQGLDRAVALKVLRPEVTSAPGRVARFQREARAASRLDHPHVVRVLDYGEDGPDRLLYLSMELVEGETLSSLVDRELGLPPERAVRIVAQVLSALADAHDAGVVHRDLKPANVLITQRADDEGVPRDFAKVCDFGLARLLDEDSGELTQEGQTLGTPAFMSPEQALGRPADTRSDVYAAGLVLYEALTGAPPFVADTPVGVMLKQVAEAPPRLGAQLPDVDPLLDDIVSWAIAKAPEARCPSARQLRKALLGWLDTRSSAPSVTSLRPALPSALPSAPPSALPSAPALPLRRPTQPLPAVLARPAPAPAVQRGVVVLPLEARSAERADQLFADAMTDALITALAKMKALRVISATSSMRLRGSAEPIHAIAASLGVTHAVEGSVLRAGERVRISARLVDAAADTPAWAESYDRALTDVLALQDEVADAIARAVKGELAPAAPPPRTRVVAPAYEAYVEGRAQLARRTPTALRLALVQLRQATALDPSFAPGFAGLADAYAMLAAYDVMPPSLALPRAIEAAQRAVALDEHLAEAHTAVAFATLHHLRDFDRAEWSYRFALELAPGSADAWHWYAELLAARGRFDEALAAAEAARARDPLSPLREAAHALVLHLARRPAEAWAVAEAALARSPTCLALYPVAAWALVELGRHAEAVAVAEAGVGLHSGFAGMDAALGYAKARAGDAVGARAIAEALAARELDQYVPAFYRAAVAVGLGAPEEALASLERAREEGTTHLLFVGVDPAYDPLRGHPGFEAWVRRVLDTRVRSG